jgi:prepilin-type N-terminal cleavage/methylation domain-containing protein
MRISECGPRNEKQKRMQDGQLGGRTQSSELRSPNSRGFTLIEAIITIVIVGIISSIAALIILAGMNASSKQLSLSGLHYQARLGVERMAREIRMVRSQTVTDIPTMNAADFRFTDSQGIQMGFRLNAGNIQRTQDNAATWQTLASGVTSLNFSYLQQNGVTPATATTLWFVVIDMTDTQGADSLPMRTRVHPMSF